jgi:predicted dehydrogenase
VLAVASRSGARIAVAHQARAFPIIHQVKAMVDGGAIGRLRAVRGYGKCDPRGGGQDLIGEGNHVLDLMRYYAGEVAWVQAHVIVNGRDAGPTDVREGERGVGLVAGDSIRAAFAYASGVAGSFEAMPLVAAGSSCLSVLLEGTAGLISIRSFGDQNVYRYPHPVVLPGMGHEWERILPDSPAPAGANVHAWGNHVLMRDLLDAIRTGREPLSSAADARATLEVTAAVFHAHRTGCRTVLPLVEREHALSRW